MLRPVLIGLVLLNGALLAAHWGGAGHWLAGAGPREHEPERLQRQVHPEWLRVTPVGGAANAASAAGAASGGASPRVPPAAASGPGAGAASGAARASGLGSGAVAGVQGLAPAPASHAAAQKTLQRVCLESGPFDAATLASAQRLLREAGVPERTWQTVSAPATPRHVILMGRYADPEHLQRKTGELRRRGVAFTEVHSSPDIPARYLPGLVLGRYAEPGPAEAALAALRARGVVTARLVTADPHASGTLLRVAGADDDGLRARATALTLPGRHGWRDCSSARGAATAASALLPPHTSPSALA